MSPERNGEDLLALQQALRHLRLHIAEERVQSREAMVLGADRDMPVVAQVIQERLDQACVDVLERQSFQGDAAQVATVPEQEGKYIAVGLDGVGAQIALGSQVVRQEVGQVHGEVGRLHDSILRGMTSPKVALARTVISGSSSAVRCR